MLLQLGLVKENKKYHRSLWHELDNSREPDVYEFQRLATSFAGVFVLRPS